MINRNLKYRITDGVDCTSLCNYKGILVAYIVVRDIESIFIAWNYSLVYLSKLDNVVVIGSHYKFIHCLMSGLFL